MPTTAAVEMNSSHHIHPNQPHTINPAADEVHTDDTDMPLGRPNPLGDTVITNGPAERNIDKGLSDIVINTTGAHTGNKHHDDADDEVSSPLSDVAMAKYDPGTDSRRNSKTTGPTFLSYMQQLSDAWSDMPVVDITYQDLQYDIQIAKADTSIPSMWRAFRGTLESPITIYNELRYGNDNNPRFQTLHALHHVSGSIRAGETTLVLAPPGHGKSAFLKALAGQLHGPLAGDIRYNGLTRQQAQETGLRLDKLAVYCNQTDAHLATLTVRETIEFALNNAVVDTKHIEGSSAELNELHRKKVDLVLQLLNLTECQNTIAGNDLLRGISGGQKKRLTIGEMLISNARIFALDEITNGLDSAVAYDINLSLKQWAAATKSTIITALLQPTPETYSLFDKVVLLREGQVIYHGPRSEVIPYLHSLGAHQPEVEDDADWIINFLVDPAKYMNHNSRETSSNSRATTSNGNRNITVAPKGASSTDLTDLDNSTNQQPTSSLKRNDISSQDFTKHFRDQINPSPFSATEKKGRVLPSSSKLAEVFTHTLYYSQMQQEIEAVKGTQPQKQQLSKYTHKQYTQKHALSFGRHVALNIQRQVKIVSRDATQWAPRFATAIIMGLILGGLFFNIPQTDFGDRLGLMLFAVVNSAFANMAELPATDAAKGVVYKQLDHQFYPSTSYIIANILINIPIQVIESMIMSSTVYWMSNFAPDVGRFFFFFLMIFITNLVISVWFRSISYATSNQFIAQQIDGPIIGIAMIFGGFLITRSKIPIWLIEFYWLSPFSWVVHSMALSEFTAPRYVGGEGDYYLLQFGMYTDVIYKWMGFLYLCVLFVLGAMFCSYLLHTKRFELSIGTKRPISEEEEITTTDEDLHKIDMVRQASNSSQKMPFIPITLAWQQIGYTVPIKGEDDRKLLTNINGFCRPGEMTALMGSSGAGKTTLMDVIAGRKTAGKMDGQILLNGNPKEDKSFAALVGYCEQQDLHKGFATVRESLLFSATLRLPNSVDKKTREEFVDELLILLELDKLRNRIIGDESYHSLSPAQKKLVTIGVELAANPSVIFLDEPTSGLDSRSAVVVMRVVRRIAATGRTVLCTIHQPSSDIFFMFDRLLLLKSGGICTYFGDVGTKGKSLIKYMENASPESNYKCPKGMNPASWMLDVISDKTTDFAEVYTKSSLNQENMTELERVTKPQLERQTSVMTEGTRPGTFTQFLEVFKRENISYYRNAPFNYTRAVTQLALGIIYGLVFLNLAVDDFGGVTSLKGGIFMALGFGGVLNCSTVMPVIAAERAVFYRERSSNMYSSWSYGFTLFLVEFPHVLLGAFLYTVPFYFMMGLKADGAIYFRYWVMQVFFGLAMNGVGHGLAAALPNIVAATQVQGLLLTFAFLFGGVFISPTTMPAGWKWIWTIDPLPKALNEMILDQTQNNYNLVQVTPTTTQTVRDYAADSLSASYGYYAIDLGWLVLITMVIRFLALLALRYISHIKR